MIINKLFGFTLNEVLITIGILGIVAAMTIPAVVTNHQKQAFLTSLQKSYSELEQNLTILSTEKYNKGLSASILCKKDKTIIESAGKFLKEYYNVNKDCVTSTQTCFASSYKSLKNNSANFRCNTGYSVQLKNGVAMCIIPAPNAGDDAEVYIDVNGNKKPNIGGKDMFSFKINDKFEIYDDSDPSDCSSSTTGKGCLAKILEDNWRMNY